MTATSPELLAALSLRYVAAKQQASKAWAEYRHQRENEEMLRHYARKLRHCARLQKLINRISS